MLLGRTFASFLVTALTGGVFRTGVNWLEGPRAGAEVSYFELTGFTALTDAGIFLFGLTMFVEAIAMLALLRAGRRGAPVLAVALFVTVCATLFNAFVVFRLFIFGMMPLISALAVAFGVYVAMYQWRWLKVMRLQHA